MIAGKRHSNAINISRPLLLKLNTPEKIPIESQYLLDETVRSAEHMRKEATPDRDRGRQKYQLCYAYNL